jgi:P-type Cu2+ transporter
LQSHDAGDGLRRSDLSVPDMTCGGCMQKIEAALGKLDRVARVRANLSARRVSVFWNGEAPPPLISALRRIGYAAHIFSATETASDPALSRLLRALAVAGFGATNIMMLSVAIWAGADPDTRDLFHWMSAVVALPTLAYSGQIFFRSAWHAPSYGQTNMDVPISISVLLAFGMSLHETIHHGPYAYFDAAVSLLFFLLIGRTLDHVMRERARQTVTALARLSPGGALVRRSDGTQIYLPIEEIEPGMILSITAGERIPVDGRVIEGFSELDCSLVSGESAPQPANKGTELQPGVLNLTGALAMVVTSAAKESFLAEMMRMMETAEAGRSHYRRIADRAARLYVPVVHATALLTFVGWMAASGDARRAITIAIAVLIITCPCALGLAVPMVHVVAAGRLFEAGIMVREGSALERLATVDTALFDKTGTLTSGRLQLARSGHAATDALTAAIASSSRHPYSQALAALGSGGVSITFDVVTELPGKGIEAQLGNDIHRLGRPDWASAGLPCDCTATVMLSMNGREVSSFHLEDRLRPATGEAIEELTKSGVRVEILSGDSKSRVGEIAGRLAVPFIAAASPADKLAHISKLRVDGHKVLMIGDGLNDAPALAAADVSMAPASAADIGRNAADLVFLRDSLAAVPEALAIARAAHRLVQQNFVLAIAYNIIVIPVAVLGHVTPLIAAVAMSTSSILVVANALRLRSSSLQRRSVTFVGGNGLSVSPGVGTLS